MRQYRPAGIPTAGFISRFADTHMSASPFQASTLHAFGLRDGQGCVFSCRWAVQHFRRPMGFYLSILPDLYEPRWWLLLGITARVQLLKLPQRIPHAYTSRSLFLHGVPHILFAVFSSPTRSISLPTTTHKYSSKFSLRLSSKPVHPGLPISFKIPSALAAGRMTLGSSSRPGISSMNFRPGNMERRMRSRLFQFQGAAKAKTRSFRMSGRVRSARWRRAVSCTSTKYSVAMKGLRGTQVSVRILKVVQTESTYEASTC